MRTTIVANAAMQGWVAGVASDPRPVPARLRRLLSGGIVERDGGVYFAAQLPTPEKFAELHAKLPQTVELEGFINTVWLNTLTSIQRTPAGSDAWAHECVAVALALGQAVIDAAALVSENVIEVAVSLDFGEETDYAASTFRFSSVTDAGGWSHRPDEYDQPVFTMRRAAEG